MSSVHSQGSDTEDKNFENSNSSRNNPDNLQLSHKATITFEKKKVPPRCRTQSFQSVLSSISLKSMINNNNSHTAMLEVTSEDQDRAPYAPTLVVPNFAGNIQQVQSPAFGGNVSKRLLRSSTGSNIQNYHGDQEGNMFGITRIGEKLPFTDDQRINPERQASRLGKLSNVHRVIMDGDKGAQNNENLEAKSSKSSEPSTTTSSFEEDEFLQQKRLTTDALRQLSIIHQDDNNIINDITSVSNKNFVDSQKPLVNLQFGDKNVILDTVRKNSVATLALNAQLQQRKASMDMINQPDQLKLQTFQPNVQQDLAGCNISNNDAPHSNNMSIKKHIRQINEPNKPMYRPAVLRDIAKTNITLDQIRAHSPTPSHNSTQGTLTNVPVSSSRTSTYAQSVHSTSSSFIEQYRRKLGLWLSISDKLISSQRVSLTPPTKTHWVPDYRRQSCKYCHKIFTFWERKHHCRHCGDIMCQQHVRHWLYLDSDAKFVIGGGGIGVLSKICDSCLEDYERLIKDGPNVKKKDSSTGSDSHKLNIDKCIVNLTQVSIDGTLQKDAQDDDGTNRIDTLVGSIPADWSWSSF